MSLALQPKTDGGPDDYRVMHGGLIVGRIYKRAAALRPETQWIWAVNGVPEGPPGLESTGLSATLDEAKAKMEERWSKWLAWADLSEGAQKPS